MDTTSLVDTAVVYLLLRHTSAVERLVGGSEWRACLQLPGDGKLDRGVSTDDDAATKDGALYWVTDWEVSCLADVLKTDIEPQFKGRLRERVTGLMYAPPAPLPKHAGAHECRGQHRREELTAHGCLGDALSGCGEE